MHARVALVLVMVTFLIPAGSAAAEETAWTSALNGLRLRSLPSKNAEIVAVLPFNTPVSIISRKDEYVTVSGENESGRWANISSPKGVGWIIDTYLRKEDQGISPDHPLLAYARTLFKAMQDHKPLAPYMNKNGVVIHYNSSTRCTGSSSGVCLLKPPHLFDRPFSINVVSDGDGWEDCDKHLKPEAYSVKIDVAEFIWEPLALGNMLSFTFDQQAKTWTVAFALSMEVTFGLVEDNSLYFINRIVFTITDPG